jgi:hypothetical protein
MTTPHITGLRNTGAHLVATIEGHEVELTTFRETLWKQNKVYLPPPFTDRCEPQVIQDDPNDEDSDLKTVEGCIHDPEVAAWMMTFAEGRLPKGTLR